MIKRLQVFMVVLFLLVSTKVNAAEKVLLDSDVVDLFDDGVAMMMLATSPNIELLGVTTMTGNDWSPACVASAIRQFEGLGISDIPVVEGNTPSKIAKRFKNIDIENKRFGRNYNRDYNGAGNYNQPKNWRNAYIERYDAEPNLKPLNENAVDFIIRTIKANPHEVTIVELGPSTNLATALKKAPEIATLVKRVVYMGGVFFVEGTEFPVAEFNMWVDPESAKYAIRSNFPEQVVVPLDACTRAHLPRAQYMDFQDRVKSTLFLEMLNNHYLWRYFETDERETYMWDVLAAAVVIDPSVITEEITLPVDVNDTYSLSYGETIAFRGYGPEGSKSARIILNVNEDKVHDMIRQLFDKL